MHNSTRLIKTDNKMADENVDNFHLFEGRCLYPPQTQWLPQLSAKAFILRLGYSPSCPSLNMLFGLNKRVILKVQPRGQFL